MNTFIRANLFFLLSITIFSTSLIHTVSQTPQIPQGMPGLPQMSDAEMKQLEAELAELNSMLEGLSPEEQEQVLDSMVQEAMEEVKKDLSDEGKALLDKLETGDITDEDFDKLLNELIPAEDKKEEAAPASPQTPAAKVEPKFVVTSKHQEALDRINSLINHTNLFIQKASTIPELPGTISKWEREKKIEWQPNLTWNTFRSDLDAFVSKLEQLKEKDPKTERYIHLDAILKNEALYNNLGKVEKVAAKQEPHLEEIAPIGGHKVPKSSKHALQKLLSQYSEALYVLKLGQALDSLFVQFEPKAKELREQEKKAAEKAQAEQKKGRRPGRTVTGGTPEPAYTPPFDDSSYDFDLGYDDTSQGVFIPTYEAPKQDTFLPTSRPQQTTQKNASPTFAGESPKQKETKAFNNGQSEDVQQVAIKDLPASQPSNVKRGMSSQFKKSVETEQDLVGNIVKPLEEVALIIKDNKALNTLDAELKSPGSYNPILVDQLLPDMYGSLRKTQRELNTFKASIANKPADKKKLISKTVKEKTTKSLKMINTFIAQINSAQAQLNSYPLEKQYLYFDLVDEPTYIGTILDNSLTAQADRERYIEIMQEEASNIGKTTERFIAEKKPSDEIQQTLREMSDNIETLERIKSSVTNPTTLLQIKDLAKEIKNTIDQL